MKIFFNRKISKEIISEEVLKKVKDNEKVEVNKKGRVVEILKENLSCELYHAIWT